ncbi:hypothetical protein FDI24_gp022 [Acidovorax phage ACP17]|uniref:Uncharacterized protein n=1 Tax=Acidovorax phage ACP17 TaxID=2010329 RepID=A0A218M3C9_9CAUD|nr:hypothetical protein FDI24_gp022 [Acidovorax phage ACP17]ASD50556.1 hypothetical protein [Acidovorax phage ACP17]
MAVQITIQTTDTHVVWQYQWAAKPSDEQVADVFEEQEAHQPLFRYIASLRRAAIWLLNEPEAVSVSLSGRTVGFTIYKEQS